MAVMAGGVMAHSLIPPTPGPLFVAEEMGIDLGSMILAGLVIGIITVISRYLYALWANRRWDLPMRDTPDISIDDLKHFSKLDEKDLPGFWISILPVIIPIILITGNTFLNMLITGTAKTFLQINMLKFFSVIGDPNIALAIAATIAILLLWTRLGDSKKMNKFIYEAISSAGVSPELVYQAIRGGLAGSTVMDAKAPMMMERNFKPGFRIDLHIKDLNNVMETSHKVGAPLPLAAQVLEIMQAIKQDGCGVEDHSSIVKFYEKIANVEVTK